MNLRTGDILLFDEVPSNVCANCFDSLIKCWTHSRYSHSAFVLTQGEFGLPPKTYVWESTGFNGLKDSVDHTKKFGVQIQPIAEYSRKFPGTVRAYVRRASDEAHAKFTPKAMQEIRKIARDRPYDIWPPDWFNVATGRPVHRTSKRFWCSAFVAFILTRAGVLPPNTDWSSFSCADLSSSKGSKIPLYGEDTPISI